MNMVKKFNGILGEYNKTITFVITFLSVLGGGALYVNNALKDLGVLQIEVEQLLKEKKELSLKVRDLESQLNLTSQYAKNNQEIASRVDENTITTIDRLSFKVTTLGRASEAQRKDIEYIDEYQKNLKQEISNVESMHQLDMSETRNKIYAQDDKIIKVYKLISEQAHSMNRNLEEILSRRIGEDWE